MAFGSKPSNATAAPTSRFSMSFESSSTTLSSTSSPFGGVDTTCGANSSYAPTFGGSSLFGSSSSPAFFFGPLATPIPPASSSALSQSFLFGTTSSAPSWGFATSSSVPAFGGTSLFGSSSSSNFFFEPSATPILPVSSSALSPSFFFRATSSAPSLGFATSSTPAFGGSSLFGSSSSSDFFFTPPTTPTLPASSSALTPSFLFGATSFPHSLGFATSSSAPAFGGSSLFGSFLSSDFFFGHPATPTLPTSFFALFPSLLFGVASSAPSLGFATSYIPAFGGTSLFGFSSSSASLFGPPATPTPFASSSSAATTTTPSVLSFSSTPTTTTSSTPSFSFGKGKNSAEKSILNGWGPAVVGHTPHSEPSSSGWLDKPAKDPSNGWDVPETSSSSHATQQNILVAALITPNNPIAPTMPSAPPIPEDLVDGPLHYPSINSTPVEVPTETTLDGPVKIDEKKEYGVASSSCVICLDALVEGAYIPCGHMAGCMFCLNDIKSKKWECPICHAKINQVIRLYVV